MTNLETKIFNFIEKQYEAKFLGKVKVTIEGTDKTVIQNIPSEITTEVKTIKYGRLYNWYAATDSRGIAPIGWHIPSKEEWQILIDYVGGSEIAGLKLKDIGTTNWQSPNNGTNYYNFNSYGSGRYDTSSHSFYNFKQVTEYQTTENGWSLALQYNNDSSQFGYSNIYYPGKGISIRLIKDNSINEGDIIIDGDTYNTVKIGDQVWLQQNLAVKHYQNGDIIGNNFSIMEGAVTSYNNDESNVYNISTKTEIIYTPISIIIPTIKEYCLSLILNNYMIPMPICMQALNEDTFYKYICKELQERNFPIIKYFKLIKNDTNDDQDTIYK